MRRHSVIAAAALGLATSAHAHRTEGMLQSSLVEVLASKVGIEVSLTPGMDIAPQVVKLLDADGDGYFSSGESAAWADRFLTAQQVLADGKHLTLQLSGVQASPLTEMAFGHGEISVHFTAVLNARQPRPRLITCINNYQAVPSTYQTNGLVSNSPDVRITGHQRNESQSELRLNTDFGSTTLPVVAAVPASRRVTFTVRLAAFMLSVAAAVAVFHWGKTLLLSSISR